ncbi:MAG TPA: DNA replication/repair protein RecF [Ilumatobacteraceae bacterium]|nr:DNA replication/repair protein RecF [Ilumatobacteraceae bacterium]
MIVERLELVDFRNYSSASFRLTAGTTVVVGDNGQGKTNLAEALAYLATLSSFRGAPPDALVRVGAHAAIVRAELRDEDGRPSLIEAELVPAGRNRVQVNRQRLGRARDLLGVVRVSVFSPDDLTLVKGAPSDRRRFLDDTLVALAVKYDALRLELDRIVRQRNMLLRQAAGRLDEAATVTLDVWDTKLAEVGDRFGHARATLVERIRPFVADAYDHLAGRATEIGLVYEPAWRADGLGAALAAARVADVKRGVSTVGPHRDEVTLSIGGLPARTHASQGEQRTLALSLRLGAHRLVADRTGSTPVLVLDDVLSELDPSRATALLGHLPHGQVVITTASAVPPAARPDRVMRVAAGRVVGDDLPAETVVRAGAP